MKHSFLKSDLANNSGEASISVAFIYVLPSLHGLKHGLKAHTPEHYQLRTDRDPVIQTGHFQGNGLQSITGMSRVVPG